MDKTIKLLAGFFALQLVLVAGVHLTGPSFENASEPTSLVSVGIDDVDRIEIAGADGQKVAFTKRGEDWVLPALGDFPANSVRTDRLLEQLEDLKVRSPIATSRAAQDRFKVADNDFERRITLFEGERELTRLYLGTSSGMRQTHARASSENEVFVIDLPTYDLNVDPSGWANKSILSVPESSIERVRVGELEMSRAPSLEGDGGDITSDTFEGWQAAGLTEEQRLSPGAVDKLVGQLASLRLDEVLLDEHLKTTEVALELTAFLSDGETRSYTLRLKDNDFMLQVSDRAEVFRLSSYQAERLLEAADPELLVEVIDQDQEAVAGAADGEAAEESTVDS